MAAIEIVIETCPHCRKQLCLPAAERFSNGRFKCEFCGGQLRWSGKRTFLKNLATYGLSIGMFILFISFFLGGLAFLLLLGGVFTILGLIGIGITQLMARVNSCGKGSGSSVQSQKKRVVEVVNFKIDAR